MPITPTYALTAVQIPALVLPAAILDPLADPAPPNVLQGFSAMDQIGVALKHSQNARYVENLGRYGGGAYAPVAGGLTLVEGTGLQIKVLIGAAALDGIVVKTAADPIGAPTVAQVLAGADGVVDASQLYVWLRQNKTFLAVANSLSPPAGACAYLGRATTAGGVVTALDFARWELRAGLLYRRTGDAGMPADTPAASVVFLAETLGGLYLWNGTAYFRIDQTTLSAAQFLTLAFSGGLSAERRFVPGAALIATEGGANADYTVDVNPDNATLEVASDALRVKASGIQDSHLAIPYSKADGTRPFTGDQSLGSHKLTNVTDPSAAQDAATKAYVDAVASGLDVKASCRAASTGNLTLSGTQTIDGVACIAGDRVLVKDQGTASQNGVYTVASGAWGRAADADTNAEVTSGLFTFVEEGTVNAGTGWVLTTANPLTVGSTGLSFTQFSGAGEITAGTGLTKAGNTLNVVANADGSILANADDLQVGVLATDGQHGSRGGGSLHAGAVAAGAAGFLSGSDKSKLDGVAAGAPALGLIVFGAQGALPSALTRYLAPGSGNVSINEIKVRLLVACTAQLLAVRTSAAPGTGVSDVITVRKNGSDTALTATLADTNTEAEDTGHTVAFASGDDLSVKLVSGTLTASQDMMVSLVLK